MTTIDQIRARHAHNCAGPCDVAYLLAELDAAGRLLKTAYLANDAQREQIDAARRRDDGVRDIRRLAGQAVRLSVRNTSLRRALRRAADELEALTGEPQPWLASVLDPS